MWWQGKDLAQSVKSDPLLSPKRPPVWDSTLAPSSASATTPSSCSTRASRSHTRVNAGCVAPEPALRCVTTNVLRRSRSRNGSAPPGGRRARGPQEQPKSKEQRERAKRPASASALLRGSGGVAAEDSFRQQLEDREVQNTKDRMRREASLQRSLIEQASADGYMNDLLMSKGGRRNPKGGKGRPGSAPAGLGGARTAQHAGAAAGLASGVGAIPPTPMGRSQGKLRRSSDGPKTATEEVKELCRVLDSDILHHCGRLDMRQEAAKWCLSSGVAQAEPGQRGRGFSLLKDGIARRLGPAIAGLKVGSAWEEDVDSDAGAADFSALRRGSHVALNGARSSQCQ